jgi:chromosome segregation ATPase
LIGIVGFTGLLFAQERDAALGATPPAQAAQGQPSARPAFQWQDSVAGIRKTASDLLDVNQKLTQEQNALNEEAAGLQAEITRANEQNKTIQEAILSRQMEALAPVSKTASVQNDVVLTKRVIAQEKQAVSVLSVKRKNMESSLGLLQLKIKQLELDKRAVLVDKKARQDASSFDGKPELNRLKASLESLRNQEEDLREKIADAGDRTPVPTNEDRALMSQRDTLKAELERLNQEKADINRRIKERNALMKSMSYKRYLELVARKEALTKKEEELKKPKAVPQTRVVPTPVAEPPPPSRDLEADLKDLNDENKKITEQVGDLRENVAVLEYKINTLERYKTRNKEGR